MVEPAKFTREPAKRQSAAVVSRMRAPGRQRRRSARGARAACGTVCPRRARRGGAAAARRARARLVQRHQLVLAVADQIGAPHAAQRLAQQRPVLRVVIAQERLVQAPHLEALRTVTSPPARRTRAAGSCRVWYIAVALAIGDGRNAWTWSARKPLRLSHSASASMSSSVVPGCAAMKYGIRYCFLPASFEYWSNSSLNAIVGADAPASSSCCSGPSSVCSGAIFR